MNFFKVPGYINRPFEPNPKKDWLQLNAAPYTRPAADVIRHFIYDFLSGKGADI